MLSILYHSSISMFLVFLDKCATTVTHYTYTLYGVCAAWKLLWRSWHAWCMWCYYCSEILWLRKAKRNEKTNIDIVVVGRSTEGDNRKVEWRTMFSSSSTPSSGKPLTQLCLHIDNYHTESFVSKSNLTSFTTHRHITNSGHTHTYILASSNFYFKYIFNPYSRWTIEIRQVLCRFSGLVWYTYKISCNHWCNCERLWFYYFCIYFFLLLNWWMCFVRVKRMR